MSANTPLLETIEPDEPTTIEPATNTTKPVVLTPTNHAADHNDAESGIAGIFKQSAHPVALFFLYLFRIGAILVYIFCGLFTDNYVISTVLVVVLLAMDFWNCRNVAGRTLVGLRYWNQVDEDGESYWVFESRDPSRPANPIDARMFWIASYTFPLLWMGLLIISFLKFNLSFVPITLLALVFNVTNAVGFTYADRDAKQKWASGVVWDMGIGGLSGQLFSGVVKNSVGRVFGSR